MKDVKFKCDECNSEDVEIKMWVNPNTEELGGETSTDVLEDGWCKNCQEHALIRTK